MCSRYAARRKAGGRAFSLVAEPGHRNFADGAMSGGRVGGPRQTDSLFASPATPEADSLVTRLYLRACCNSVRQDAFRDNLTVKSF